jgi:uncharacterized protein YlzI (FlbEa/FlbD family)
MIIKLTNAVKEMEGKPFLLNTDTIISVFEGKDENELPAIFIYGQNDKTWMIKETVEEVFAMVSK